MAMAMAIAMAMAMTMSTSITLVLQCERAAEGGEEQKKKEITAYLQALA